jgi:ABC-2 type transport system ATP-binding protein
LSFDVNPGIVTSFIGPNGSGKTTTMRLILGLSGPTSGKVTVGGRRYRDLPAPLREVGALIDAKAVHPSRTAHHYLLALALSNAIAASRVDEVLGLVGMEGVAGKRVGGFSLGMSQRLGIAGTLLGGDRVSGSALGGASVGNATTYSWPGPDRHRWCVRARPVSR